MKDLFGQILAALDLFRASLFSAGLMESGTFWLYLFQFLSIALVLVYLYVSNWGTQSHRIINGFFLLVAPVVLSYAFKLSIFTKLFELFLPALFVVMAVVFAPELRRFLGDLGGRNLSSWGALLAKQGLSFQDDATISAEDRAKSVLGLIEAVRIFSRNKTGALLIFDSAWSERLFINSGCRVDAILSTELLLNIFYPKSPLHDGAVLICDFRIHSASVILPITENSKLNPWQYGTRHRAALGISELSPTAFCIVVSEETGSISLIEKGKLSKISSDEQLALALKTKLNKTEP